MVIETIVPLNDVCFSNKITRPCKEYSVIFIFGFMGNHKDRIIEEPMDNGIEIGFKVKKSMFKIRKFVPQ